MRERDEIVQLHPGLPTTADNVGPTRRPKVRGVTFRRFLACATAVCVVTLGLSTAVAGQTRPVARSGRISSYATLARVHAAIMAAENLGSPPSHVTPAVSVLAANLDWGGDLQGQTGCPSLGTGASTFNLAKCVFGDKKSKTVVALVGDSRAQMWLDAFNTLGVAEHFKLVLIAKSGCPVPVGTYETNNDGAVSDAPWAACTSFHSFLISSLVTLHPQVVVVSSNYELDLADPPHVAAPAQITAATTSFLKEIPPSAKTVVLGGFPQPADTSNPTLCLSKGPSRISSCNFVPSSTVVAENAAAEAAATASSASFINQTPWFCATTCPAVIGSIIPYTIDGYHADKTYLNYLTGVLWDSFKPYLS